MNCGHLPPSEWRAGEEDGGAATTGHLALLCRSTKPSTSPASRDLASSTLRDYGEATELGPRTADMGTRLWARSRAYDTKWVCPAKMSSLRPSEE